MLAPIRTEFIYALRDPETGLIRYIGKSVRPSERLRNHMNDSSKCHRTNWLQSLKCKGLCPELLILEEIEIFRDDHPSNMPMWDWQYSERYWIATARRLGWPLVNGTNGGDGVEGLSEESRSKIRKAWIGRRHSDETKKKIGASSMLRRHSPERRERIRALMSGRSITWGNKISGALLKLTNDDVKDILLLFMEGARVCDIAARYGVHRTTISKIKKGTYYDKCRG